MNKHRAIFIAFLALLLYTVSFVIFNLVVASVLADESAALLTSFSVVNTVVAFATYFFGFLYVTTVAAVGKHDAEKDWYAVGRYIQWMGWLSLICGVMATLVLTLLSDQVITLFSPGDELVPDTKITLQIMSSGLSIGLIGSMITGVFIGLVHLVYLVSLSMLLGFVYVSLSIGLYYAGYGLVAFAWGTLAGKIIYTVGGLGIMFWSPNYKRYNIWELNKLSELSQQLQLTWDYFRQAVGYTTVRSFVTNTRFMISLILAVRLGVVEGAVYTLVDKLSAVTYNITRQLGNLIGLVTSRLTGIMSDETTENAYNAYRGIIAFSKLVIRFGITYGLIILGYYGIYGETLLLNNANDEERSDYEDSFTKMGFVLFLLMQPLHSITSIYEALLIGVQEFKYVAYITFIPFIVGYVPCVIYGYLVEETITFIILADVVYFSLRAAACLIIWHFKVCLDIEAKLGTDIRVMIAENSNEATSGKFANLCKLLLGSYPKDLKSAYTEFVENWDVNLQSSSLQPLEEQKQGGDNSPSI